MGTLLANTSPQFFEGNKMVEVVKEVLSYGEQVGGYGKCKITKDGREWIELYGIVWNMKPSEQVWNDLEKTAEEIEQKFNVKCLVAITPAGHIPTVFLSLKDAEKRHHILQYLFSGEEID